MLWFFRSKKNERPVSDTPYTNTDKPLPQTPPTRQVSAPTRRYNRTPPLPPTQNVALHNEFCHAADSNSDDDVTQQEEPMGVTEHPHKSNVDLAKSTISQNVSKAQESSSTLTLSRKKKEQPTMTHDEEILQSGIKSHEEGRLEEATEHFKQSAALGNPNGMFLYGISLRHGWGCEPNPNLAFQYLHKAAESAIFDLNILQPNAPESSKVSQNAVAHSELVLAIYELGVCFRHGWGVPKSKSMAVYYFEIAANMGEPDAQSDLGFCYLNGEGVKRDKKKAAMYYRMASDQGHTIPGNSWIFKKKYD